MAGAVLPDQPGAVDRQQDGRIVLADVVDQLVVGALAEGGVERHDRPQAGQRHAGGHRHGVLLGDADVEEARLDSGRAKRDRPVPVGMPAVMAQIRSSVSARRTSSSTKVWV